MTTENYGTSGQDDQKGQQSENRNHSGDTNRNLASRESDRTNYQGSGRGEDQGDMNLDSGASERSAESSRSEAREWNTDDMSTADYSAAGSESEDLAEDSEEGWDRNTDTDRGADQRNDREDSL